MPSITTREYNPSTGEFVSSISSLSFGQIVVGTRSPVKVIDFAFSGVNSVSNIKVGLLNSGGITVNDSPTDIGDDGSAGNGKFGIMHSTNFDLSIAQGPLTRFFAGLNESGSAADPNNVLIENREDTICKWKNPPNFLL